MQQEEPNKYVKELTQEKYKYCLLYTSDAADEL